MNIEDTKTKLDLLVKTLNEDQLEIFNRLVNEVLHQFRVPTGVGKGYVMIVHILYSLIATDLSKFVIASHRLSLNNQHLRDLIDFFIKFELIDKVKFLTIGSQVLSIDKLFKDDYDLALLFNKQLFDYNYTKPIKQRITQDDVFLASMSKKDINKIIKKNDINGFKTIVITTYNSLDKLKDIPIDVTYLDEAHILASNNEEADFKKSYEMITSKKRFFFTATPKDMQIELLNEDHYSDIFLMNNKEIFGESYEIPFVSCVKKGYITEPIIHIAYPKEIGEFNYESIENKSKFVKETYEAHEKWLKESSYAPAEISPKMLVRCESVPVMWDMYSKLIDILPNDVILCAGASYNPNGVKHVIGKEWESNRDEFVKKIQRVASNKKMIILNFDIFSEGINVPGITGVMFLQGKMPSLPKVVQNVGRSTRLHAIDRIRFKNNEIVVGGKDWVKPNCAVIIPYWDSSSEFTKNILADIIRKLRSKFDFSPNLILSVGDDFAKTDNDIDLDGLNNVEKSKKKWKLIDEINQEIEKLDLIDVDQKEKERIEKMSELEFFQLINNNI